MNYQGYNRFQEPDDETVECQCCGKQIELGDAIEQDDKYFCECCYDDLFVTI